MQQEHLAELEPDVRILTHGIADRGETLEITRDRECVVVRHLVEPFVRHHRREQAPVFAHAVANRANDLGIGPCAEAGLVVRGEIGGAGDADPPVAKLVTTAQRTIGIPLLSRMTAAAYGDVADDGFTTRDERRRITSRRRRELRKRNLRVTATPERHRENEQSDFAHTRSGLHNEFQG